jgi:enoyl-CoA hydratase/carnithine racemase
MNVIWSPKISIAAVDGIATAGGIELALVCDIILVSETAEVFDSHVKNLELGVGSGSVTTSLTRKVGYSKALELLITAEPMDGKEAYRTGFANHVYPPDRLLPEAKNLARKIAGMRPSAVHTTKLSCRSVNADYNQVWDNSEELLREQYHLQFEDGDEFVEHPGLKGVTQQWEKRIK